MSSTTGAQNGHTRFINVDTEIDSANGGNQDDPIEDYVGYNRQDDTRPYTEEDAEGETLKDMEQDAGEGREHGPDIGVDNGEYVDTVGEETDSGSLLTSSS